MVENGWIALAGAAIGFASSAANEWLRDRRSRLEDQRSKSDARKQKIVDDRAEFQRVTLLELQEELQQLMRSAGQITSHDAIEERKGKSFKATPLPEDLNEKAMLSQAKTTLLVARCRDDEVRSLVGEIKKACTMIAFASTSDESRACLNTASDAYHRVNDRIGRLLRELDLL